MTFQDVIELMKCNSGLLTAVVFILLTLIEITPIKVNPWSWVGNKIGKAFNGEVMTKIGNLEKEIKGIKTDVADIREEAKEREATSRRTRILEFGDEILHEVDYSKEHWDSVLMDISEYEHYCDDHPHYMNNVAKATIKHIKYMYDKHLIEDSFL